jgi:hypothetical protein
MKRFYFRSLMFLALGTMIISCSKEEEPVAKLDAKLETVTKAVTQEYSFTYPQTPLEPGNAKPSTIHFPPAPDDPWSWPSYPFTKILTPTPAYLEETCLVDVSKLENGKTYNELKNGKLTMGFFGSPYNGDNRFDLVKLKSNSATGWNSSWGVSPNVEGENPDVFYAGINRDELVIYFSKPLIEFGFEVAPNRKNGDHSISAQYGDWLFDSAKGGAGVISQSPNGARLIAVKATKPFTMVMITLGDHPTQDIPARGIALANFRYKLAK